MSGYDMQKRAKLRCMHLLEKRDYTEQELRNKLIRGKTEYTDEDIEAAIEYVKSFHYVDDARYAEKYIECMSSRKSMRQIRQELAQRGVDQEVIRNAFEEAGEFSEEGQILNWMRKKGFQPETADRKEYQKMYAFLARKGFNPDEIRSAMRTDHMESTW